MPQIMDIFVIEIIGLGNVIEDRRQSPQNNRQSFRARVFNPNLGLLCVAMLWYGM